VKKIAAFYHVYQDNDWMSLFEEQFGLLKSSGLFDIADHVHVGVNGVMLPEISGVHAEINQNQHMEESDTLKSLLAYANENDANILYMHTKGISRPSPEMTDWRRLMEYFCVEKWRECVDLLDDHGAVGCNYLDHCMYGFFPHFSGNFWWATAEHVRRLDHSYLDAFGNYDSRFMREFWIGSAGQEHLHELHHSGIVWHGAECYPPEKYRDDL
jgi:hypothetical protein